MGALPLRRENIVMEEFIGMTQSDIWEDMGTFLMRFSPTEGYLNPYVSNRSSRPQKYLVCPQDPLNVLQGCQTKPNLPLQVVSVRSKTRNYCSPLQCLSV
ncbi:hypothetical protein RF11_03232 [Thelohanellus kitauei]|uniref:Uncharacterized protein n=1 Tax=Thelohanellus kitauei TaxID=669202 RepID=A0A0C2MR64_THEKT|nr:hypothetical protein RF11_03232 [Thelohanellus kitauei]